MSGFQSKRMATDRMSDQPLDFRETGSFEEFAAMEIARLNERVEQLTSGLGGIMEMKQTISDKEKYIEQLETALQEIAEWKDEDLWRVSAQYLRNCARYALVEKK